MTVFNENIYFENHQGDQIIFDGETLIIDYSRFRSYEWQVETVENLITGFYKGMVKKTIPVIIAGTDILGTRDLLHTVFDKDIQFRQKGFFSVNGYTMKCYVIGIENISFVSDSYMTCNLIIVTDASTWESSDVSVFDTAVAEAVGAFEYPYAYPYGYTSSFPGASLDNQDFSDNYFVMEIFGPIVNPSIIVGPNTYTVYTTLEAGEYLRITSGENIKTVYKYPVSGDSINIFADRDKINDIFAKMPAGVSHVSWSGLFTFSIELIQNRSEPLWVV